jgi:hypothetical protein
MEKNEKNKIAKLDKVNEEILILAAEGLMCSNFHYSSQIKILRIINKRF